jgi:hypothetical protein
VFTYVAYGLGIHSALELPELIPGPARPDVIVRLGDLPSVPSTPPDAIGLLRMSADEAWLHWPDVGAILVRRGREITLDPPPGTAEDLLRAYLLGPVLGLLLHQRGLLVLHASAIALDGGVVAFLGQAGHGKSTTAASLHARGYPVVADDVVAVDFGAPGGPAALPGFPQLKLWPDAVTALGETPESLPRVHAGEDKRVRRVAPAGTAPRSLRRLYVLTDAEALDLEPLTGHAAVFELLQHSPAALEGLDPSGCLAQCARLAAAVPVRRLCRPRRLGGLGELAALVERDAGS